MNRQQQNGGKYVQIMCLIRGWYSKYIKKSYNTIEKQRNLTKKMGKEPEWTFYQRRHMNSQQVHKTFPNINNHHGTANQNHNELSPHTCKRLPSLEPNWIHWECGARKGDPTCSSPSSQHILLRFPHSRSNLSQVKLKTKSRSSCPWESNKHESQLLDYNPTFPLLFTNHFPFKKTIWARILE